MGTSGTVVVERYALHRAAGQGSGTVSFVGMRGNRGVACLVF